MCIDICKLGCWGIIRNPASPEAYLSLRFPCSPGHIICYLIYIPWDVPIGYRPFDDRFQVFHFLQRPVGGMSSRLFVDPSGKPDNELAIPKHSYRVSQVGVGREQVG